jgi:hypothetical protein
MQLQSWVELGSMPVVVDATQLLVEAQLHDDVPRNSPVAVSLMYSSAIIRCLLGLKPAY